MATDEGGLGGDGPVTLGGVEVGVANTSAVHLQEDLTGLELVSLGDGPVVDDLEGSSSGADHGGLHGLGDNVVASRHGG